MRLYGSLPKLSKAQWRWIDENVVGTRIFTSGKKCWCSHCGHEWNGTPDGEHATCPHCGRESKVEKSRKTTYRGYDYVQFFHIYHGWQVIRYTLIRWDCKKGRKQLVYDMDAIQKWCQPGRPMITLGTALTMYPDWREIPYSLWGYGLVIKPNHHDWYNEWMECKTYPKMSLLPVYVKHIGRHPDFDALGWTAPALLGDIFGCPYLEKLWKERKDKKLQQMWKHTDMLNKYWSSVKVALRHGYEPENWHSYFDHLRALAFLHYDMHSPRYVAPKDFGEIHDLISRQYKNRLEEMQRKRSETERLRRAIQEEEWAKQREKEAKEYAQSFMERIAKFAGLEITDEDIIITPLMSIEAFKEEGDAMHHCVFSMGYYKKPESLILSARTRTENERVETVEISLEDYTIRQSMGIYNAPTKRHEEIQSLVMGAMPQIRQMATAI